MIQRTLINYLPVWLFVIFIMIFLMGLTAVIFWVVKRYFGNLIKQQSSDILGIFIGVISTNYGFLVGFVIIILWQAFNQAIVTVSNEANNLSIILYDSIALPKNLQAEIREAVGNYIHIVRKEEWELMKWGEASENARLGIVKIFEILQSYTPGTETEKSFYNQIINNLNTVLEHRRLRIEKIDSYLPNTLRFALILGTLVVAFFVSLIETKNQRVHLIVTLIVTGIMSFNIALALSLDYPFSGYISVDSTAYTTGILAQFGPP